MVLFFAVGFNPLVQKNNSKTAEEKKPQEKLRLCGKGQIKALPLLSFDLISSYSSLFFSAIATTMPLKNALTSLKFLSKAGRSAALLFGLAMCSSGR